MFAGAWMDSYCESERVMVVNVAVTILVKNSSRAWLNSFAKVRVVFGFRVRPCSVATALVRSCKSGKDGSALVRVHRANVVVVGRPVRIHNEKFDKTREANTDVQDPLRILVLAKPPLAAIFVREDVSLRM
jgi:hypothetical protein